MCEVNRKKKLFHIHITFYAKYYTCTLHKTSRIYNYFYNMYQKRYTIFSVFTTLHVARAKTEFTLNIVFPSFYAREVLHNFAQTLI